MDSATWIHPPGAFKDVQPKQFDEVVENVGRLIFGDRQA